MGVVRNLDDDRARRHGFARMVVSLGHDAGAAATLDAAALTDWVRALRSSIAGMLAAAADLGGRIEIVCAASRDAAATAAPVARVLIVEDDEDIREAIAAVVEREGFEAICVTHGLEALRYLDRCERLPNVILLDLMMPVMDGWEFLRRRDDRLRAVPVVVITAGRTEGLPADIRCLTKPVSVDILVGELRPCWNAGA